MVPEFGGMSASSGTGLWNSLPLNSQVPDAPPGISAAFSVSAPQQGYRKRCFSAITGLSACRAGEAENLVVAGVPDGVIFGWALWAVTALGFPCWGAHASVSTGTWRWCLPRVSGRPLRGVGDRLGCATLLTHVLSTLALLLCDSL